MFCNSEDKDENNMSAIKIKNNADASVHMIHAQ